MNADFEEFMRIREIEDSLKGSLLDRLAEVDSELKKLFDKYGVSSYPKLIFVFDGVPEEDGLDDYFVAQNLEYLRRKLVRLLEVLEKGVEDSVVEHPFEVEGDFLKDFDSFLSFIRKKITEDRARGDL
ncbi:hypothetical protein [Thermovibrio sp.]